MRRNLFEIYVEAFVRRGELFFYLEFITLGEHIFLPPVL